MQKAKKGKITRNKPSKFPNWAPKFYCSNEMRGVIDYAASEEESDISKTIRAMLEASPLYKKYLFLIKQQQSNETDRTVSS